MKKTIILLSGGPDSSAAIFILNMQKETSDEIQCLSFLASKMTDNSREIDCAKIIANQCNVQHKIIDVSQLDQLFSDIPLITIGMGGGNKPGKRKPFGFLGKTSCTPDGKIEAPLSLQTMHLLSAVYAVSHGFNEIVWAVHKDDNWDNSITDYIDTFNKMLHVSGYQVTIVIPFIGISKSELIKKGIEAGMNNEDTWSCLHSRENHCGKCQGCIERQSAINALNIKQNKKRVLQKSF
ncbi:MAG: 7-cyano-7-deazaguanine synthase [Candidatus Paceibacterota bacterium]|jgi:7-cyano-7-deazaguanine synthase